MVPCAEAVPVRSTTATAASLSERVIIGVLPFEATTGGTIAIALDGATAKRA
jgi:hypothetical protein